MTQDFKIPSTEIENRISTIQKALKKNSIDGLCILQHADLFYFTGTAQNGLLFIPAEGDPCFFVIRYLQRAREESSIKNITGIKSIRDVPGLIRDMYGDIFKTLAFEFDVLPVRDFEYYKTMFSASEYVDGSALIIESRMVKSPWEISQMDKTADLSRKVFEFAADNLRPGYSEIEFTGIYEAFARKHGHSGHVKVRGYRERIYNSHILSGTSGGIVGVLDAPASGIGTSPALPNGASHKIIEKGEPVMIDIGINLNGYHTDETRMFAAGSMPEKAYGASKAAIEIHNHLLEKARPGIPVHELYDESIKKADKLGYSDYYLGPENEKVIFVGHGIGIELVEQPIIAKGKKTILKPGMTFSIEPKLVCKNRFSAGIESVFVVTDTGCRLISKVPVDIFIC